MTSNTNNSTTECGLLGNIDVGLFLSSTHYHGWNFREFTRNLRCPLFFSNEDTNKRVHSEFGHHRLNFVLSWFERCGLLNVILNRNWPFGNLVCKLTRTATEMNIFSWRLLLLVMSADRYFAIIVTQILVNTGPCS